MTFCAGCGSAGRTGDMYCAACGLKLGAQPETGGIAERLFDLAFDLGALWLQNKIGSALPGGPKHDERQFAGSALPEEFRAPAADTGAVDPVYGDVAETVDLAKEIRKREEATRVMNMTIDSNRRMWDSILQNIGKTGS